MKSVFEEVYGISDKNDELSNLCDDKKSSKIINNISKGKYGKVKLAEETKKENDDNFIPKAEVNIEAAIKASENAKEENSQIKDDKEKVD